ncbi:oxidoreductase, short chain dehydrogenase/reductase family protein [Opisthorchis viverrini]|uniref:Oxidoreductase, short chain dehydrogenase/reductase family protein n=1 Tax=Opisthorchis viverrini TaxID=6198 RepID=A0A1S8X5N7_OPIVI|nr:oxidoreductase, short chain dehydrogenase/reductase family protein [Opisthorchis viverrini]
MPGYQRAKLSALNRLRTRLNKQGTRHGCTKRPQLSSLNTTSSIERSLLLIEQEIDSLLRQTTCISYGEKELSDMRLEIDRLRREYTAHKKKLKTLAQCAFNTKATNSDSVHSLNGSESVARTMSSLMLPSAMTELPLLKNVPKESHGTDGLVSYELSDEDCDGTLEKYLVPVSFAVVLALCCYILWRFYFQSRPPTNLKGYNVLITGGSSGIGLSLAELFYLSDANVTLLARDQNKLISAQEKLHASGRRGCQVRTLSVDLCAEFQPLKNQLEEYILSTGPVDILVHCAGYAVSRTFLDTTPDTIEGLIKTNYLSAVNVTKILLPHMLSDRTRSSRDRRISFVCSMAGQVGVYGFAAYSASKYALRGFAEVLRMELEHSGPLITLAFPPDTDTPGLAFGFCLLMVSSCYHYSQLKISSSLLEAFFIHQAENVGKPSATLEISSAGGLATPEQAAYTIFRDILDGAFNSSYGFEGKALSWATAGLALPVSIRDIHQDNIFKIILSSIAEVLVAGPLRAVGIGYAFWMRRVVSRHMGKNVRSSG